MCSGRQAQKNNGAYLKPLGIASADTTASHPLHCSLPRQMVLWFGFKTEKLILDRQLKQKEGFIGEINDKLKSHKKS